MMGDATLFQRADNIEAAWAVVQPALDAWGRAATRSSTRRAARGRTRRTNSSRATAASGCR